MSSSIEQVSVAVVFIGVCTRPCYLLGTNESILKYLCLHSFNFRNRTSVSRWHPDDDVSIHSALFLSLANSIKHL